jgi:hypothetical protein
MNLGMDFVRTESELGFGYGEFGLADTADGRVVCNGFKGTKILDRSRKLAQTTQQFCSIL